MSKPVIFIVGSAGSGKSAIAAAIQEVLTRYGVDVEIDSHGDEDSQEWKRVKSDWPRRLQSLRGGTVLVKTLQAPRQLSRREFHEPF